MNFVWNERAQKMSVAVAYSLASWENCNKWGNQPIVRHVPDLWHQPSKAFVAFYLVNTICKPLDFIENLFKFFKKNFLAIYRKSLTYMYMHAYKHLFVCTHKIYIYIYVCMYTPIHLHLHVNIHVDRQVFIYMGTCVWPITASGRILYVPLEHSYQVYWLQQSYALGSIT